MANDWLGDGGGVPVLLAAAILALTAMLGIGLWLRIRAARRLHAALDAYAEREIGQHPQQTKRTYSRRNLHARPQSQNR